MGYDTLEGRTGQEISERTAKQQSSDIGAINARLANLGDELQEYIHMARKAADEVFGSQPQSDKIKDHSAEVTTTVDLLERCFRLSSELRLNLNRF